jgi:hypothetical protein
VTLRFLPQIGLGAGELCLCEFEGSNDRVRRSIPKLSGSRLDPQQAQRQIVRSARPPDLVGAFPDFGRLCGVAQDLGAAGDRQIGLVAGIDEDEADIRRRGDFLVLPAAQVGEKPDDAGVAVRPRLDRPRPQAGGKLRRQHGDADLLDDIPNPINLSRSHDADPSCGYC